MHKDSYVLDRDGRFRFLHQLGPGQLCLAYQSDYRLSTVAVTSMEEESVPKNDLVFLALERTHLYLHKRDRVLTSQNQWVPVDTVSLDTPIVVLGYTLSETQIMFWYGLRLALGFETKHRYLERDGDFLSCRISTTCNTPIHRFIMDQANQLLFHIPTPYIYNKPQFFIDDHKIKLQKFKFTEKNLTLCDALSLSMFTLINGIVTVKYEKDFSWDDMIQYDVMQNYKRRLRHTAHNSLPQDENTNVHYHITFIFYSMDNAITEDEIEAFQQWLMTVFAIESTVDICHLYFKLSVTQTKSIMFLLQHMKGWVKPSVFRHFFPLYQQYAYHEYITNEYEEWNTETGNCTPMMAPIDTKHYNLDESSVDILAVHVDEDIPFFVNNIAVAPHTM